MFKVVGVDLNSINDEEDLKAIVELYFTQGNGNN
jgi:hypothetical protein